MIVGYVSKVESTSGGISRFTLPVVAVTRVVEFGDTPAGGAELEVSLLDINCLLLNHTTPPAPTAPTAISTNRIAIIVVNVHSGLTGPCGSLFTTGVAVCSEFVYAFKTLAKAVYFNISLLPTAKPL